MECKELNVSDLKIVQDLFFSVFTAEPWNDDWSNTEQLRLYLLDLMGNPNSLSYGWFDGDKLVGIALGCVHHWWTNTEYYIHEFCIQTAMQGKGQGTAFLQAVEQAASALEIQSIFLQTEQTHPAYQFYQKNGFTVLPNHISLYKSI